MGRGMLEAKLRQLSFEAMYGDYIRRVREKSARRSKLRPGLPNEHDSGRDGHRICQDVGACIHKDNPSVCVGIDGGLDCRGVVRTAITLKLVRCAKRRYLCEAHPLLQDP